MTSLADVEREVMAWLPTCRLQLDPLADPDRKLWVLKFIDPKYLSTFLPKRTLAISATPGFTWGDGVYVSPLSNPYSSMIYGRIGIMGWISTKAIGNVFDAVAPMGLDLYQSWIRFSTSLYRRLTTTVHADLANRLLRNAFRRRFDIDLVVFRPDQFNNAHVDPIADRWLLLSDWQGVRPQSPGSKPAFSSRIQEPEWVAIVQEQFEVAAFRTHYTDLIGPHLTTARPRLVRNRPPLAADLRAAYAANSGQTTPAMIRSIKP